MLSGGADEAPSAAGLPEASQLRRFKPLKQTFVLILHHLPVAAGGRGARAHPEWRPTSLHLLFSDLQPFARGGRHGNDCG